MGSGEPLGRDGLDTDSPHPIRRSTRMRSSSAASGSFTTGYNFRTSSERHSRDSGAHRETLCSGPMSPAWLVHKKRFIFSSFFNPRCFVPMDLCFPYRTTGELDSAYPLRFRHRPGPYSFRRRGSSRMELPTANVSTPAISLQTSKNTLSASYHLLERESRIVRGQASSFGLTGTKLGI